ncbi:MAG: hypothetical protein ACTS3F_05260 [Phycisphaerales bacterium]
MALAGPSAESRPPTLAIWNEPRGNPIASNHHTSPGQIAARARDRFAAMLTDASLTAEQQHEARLGYIVSAAAGGHTAAAAMSARRLPALAAPALALSPDWSPVLSAARSAAAAAHPADRIAIERALGMVRIDADGDTTGGTLAAGSASRAIDVPGTTNAPR